MGRWTLRRPVIAVVFEHGVAVRFRDVESSLATAVHPDLDFGGRRHYGNTEASRSNSGFRHSLAHTLIPTSSRPAAIGRKWSLLSFTIIFSVGAVSTIPIIVLRVCSERAQILQTVAGGSRGLGYIYAGRVIAGVGIGAISAVAPAYVSECSPKDVRGRITGLFQIMVAIGVMLSYFINCECGHIH